MTNLVNFKNPLSLFIIGVALFSGNIVYSMDKPENEIEKGLCSSELTIEEIKSLSLDDYGVADMLEIGFCEDEKLFYTPGDYLHKISNCIDKSTVKYITDSIPGSKIFKNIHQVYSQPEITATPNTLSAVLGNSVKSEIENLPGGNVIVEIAGMLKAPGKETFAQTVIECISPGTNIRVDGDVPEVVGNVAKAFVQTLPGGNYVTHATGFLGRTVFGTPTLTEGLFRMFETKDTSDDDSADDDFFVS